MRQASCSPAGDIYTEEMRRVPESSDKLLRLSSYHASQHSIHCESWQADSIYLLLCTRSGGNTKLLSPPLLTTRAHTLTVAVFAIRGPPLP
ncbi:hypothetical protein AFLA_004508 [Aspergillus flavus NRRL3357]|nr:hypothetical protein AFLA_004508 [Aspergillus flavus NRRL3357]